MSDLLLTLAQTTQGHPGFESLRGFDIDATVSWPGGPWFGEIGVEN
jgi:hypothetical protein